MTYRSPGQASLAMLAIAGMCLLAPSVGFAQHTRANEVVEAVVTYGDDKLLVDESALTDDELATLLDSLCGLDPAPQDLIKDLKLFQRMRRMEVPEMYALIDSLFELDTVPYALINEVNLYVDQLPSLAD